MNWKIVVGLIMIAGFLAVGILGAHTYTQTTSSANNGLTSDDNGPHPHLPGAWIILTSDDNGPHPHLPGAWIILTSDDNGPHPHLPGAWIIISSD